MQALSLLLVLVLVAACSDKAGNLVTLGAASASAAQPGASRPAALVLPLEVDAKLAETFVRIGYGMEKGQEKGPERGFQSTEFLTPRLRTVQAVPLVRWVRQYNDFEGERVAAALLQFRGRVSGIEFGRQGSPVLFIELPYWTHQREETSADGPGVRIPDAENERLVEELKRTFVDALHASEFSVKGRRVRVWWS